VNERRDSQKPEVSRRACPVTITFVTVRLRLTFTFRIYRGINIPNLGRISSKLTTLERYVACLSAMNDADRRTDALTHNDCSLSNAIHCTKQIIRVMCLLSWTKDSDCIFPTQTDLKLYFVG